jgi:hypothetical protein
MNIILEQNIDKIKEYCSQLGIKELYAFGSSVQGNFTNESDLDFLISFKDLSFKDYTDNYFKLHDLLEELFGRPVDLITDRSLSNPYFIKDVEKTKELIYAA